LTFQWTYVGIVCWSLPTPVRYERKRGVMYPPDAGRRETPVYHPRLTASAMMLEDKPGITHVADVENRDPLRSPAIYP
jgi:hypothetical protein